MTTFKQHLQKTAPIIFSVEKNIRTIGDLLSAYPAVSNAIKDYAMDNDWDPEVFSRLKSLRIYDEFLKGNTYRQDNVVSLLSAFHNSVAVSVSNTKNKDPLEFFKFKNDFMIIQIKDNTRLLISQKIGSSDYGVEEIHWGDVSKLVNTVTDNLHDYANYVKHIRTTGVGHTIIEKLTGWVVFG